MPVTKYTKHKTRPFIFYQLWTVSQRQRFLWPTVYILYVCDDGHLWRWQLYNLRTNSYFLLHLMTFSFFSCSSHIAVAIILGHCSCLADRTSTASCSMNGYWHVLYLLFISVSLILCATDWGIGGSIKLLLRVQSPSSHQLLRAAYC